MSGNVGNVPLDVTSPNVSTTPLTTAEESCLLAHRKGDYAGGLAKKEAKTKKVRRIEHASCDQWWVRIVLVAWC